MFLTVIDFDKSTAPKKWKKRGFQPEYVPPPKKPLIRLAWMCRQMREETDPAIIAELEREYAKEVELADMLEAYNEPKRPQKPAGTATGRKRTRTRKKAKDAAETNLDATKGMPAAIPSVDTFSHA